MRAASGGPAVPTTRDIGIFGPSSITWHLHADPAMWIGGISALHLQALHPVAARGIAQNSSFTEDPRRRLARTGAFIVATTWGGTEVAERSAARVRAMHARLSIRRPGAVRPLDDPELLRWVHCTLVWSNLRAASCCGVGLSPGQADRYVGEQRRTAGLVGLPGRDAPGSVAELNAYLEAQVSGLGCSAEAAQIHDFLLDPPLTGAWRMLRPQWRLASRLAYSIMPGWARELYGWPGYPEQATNAALRTARRAALLVPWQVRLSFPEPYARQAVGRLGRAGVPSVRRLRTDAAPRQAPVQRAT
jgi:uncharacterized protein (DUF2236 family)